MPTPYDPNGVRTRKQIESDAFKLVMVRQQDLGRKLTNHEKAAIVSREFEDEARRYAQARFPQGSGRTGTIAEIVRALMADRLVLPGISGTRPDPTEPKGVT